MAEISEIESQPSPPAKRRSLAVRRAQGTGLILAVLAPPVIGGFLGHATAMDSEHSSNRADLRRAAGLERCIPVVENFLEQGKLIVKASQLSEAQQQDCGLGATLSDIRGSYKKDAEDANIDAQHGMKITNDVDPSIQFASVDQLHSSIEGLEHSAATVGVGGPVRDAIFGVGGGLVADLGLAAAGLWVGAKIAERRRTPDVDMHTV